VHRVSVWCDRIAQNALFCVVTTVRRLELAGFDAPPEPVRFFSL
jgi:hypothetical protein